MAKEIIKKIEVILGKHLTQSPFENQLDPLRTLVACHKDTPHKYLLDEAGRLIGLKLSAAELDDAKWKQIADFLDNESVSLQALN